MERLFFFTWRFVPHLCCVYSEAFQPDLACILCLGCCLVCILLASSFLLYIINDGKEKA